MANENPIRFTITNNTYVIVKKVADNKYDFELIFTNGSRKTFIWNSGTSVDYKNRKGDPEVLIIEAVKTFISIQK